MIKHFIEKSVPELFSYPSSLHYSRMSEKESNILFQVANRYYDNLYTYSPPVGYTSLSKYKILSFIQNGMLILDFNSFDRKNLRTYVFKYIFGLNFYYFKRLVPSNVTLTKKLRDTLLDIYFTIMFRILSKHIYVIGLTTPQISFIYFLIGRVFANKIMPYDYKELLRRTRSIYKFVSADLDVIPEVVDFKTMIEFLNNRGLVVSKVSMDLLGNYLDTFIGAGARSIVEDPYYFISFIFSDKIYSPVVNTNISRYNKIAFHQAKKELRLWIKEVKI